MICLLVMTDGRRDCIEQTLASFDAQVTARITRRVIHDDSGDSSYRSWLADTFPTYGIVGGTRTGFGGAIARAWDLVGRCPEKWVFHLEDDFTFNRPVHLGDLVGVLDTHPYLAQMALRRQAWNPDEQAAGGVVEQHPGDYAEVSIYGESWLEHRRFFTTNPSLYRTSLCQSGWPDVSHSEGVFTQRLLEDPELRFGYWGRRDDEPWVEHIGHSRAGAGY